MQYEKAKKLKPKKFKRLFGVNIETFNFLVKIVKESEKIDKKDKKDEKAQPKGRPPKLTSENQVLVTLQYWREYRTYFHIAQDWDICESTVCRIVHKVEKILISSRHFSLPGKKELYRAKSPIKAILIDVTETPIERPSRKQKVYYSGKKKQHTFKAQLVVNQQNQEIICYVNGQGRDHDFKIFKQSKLPLSEKIKCLVDKGYQGIKKIHPLSEVPKKNTKKRKLTPEEKRKNRELSRERIVVEHINRRLKIFKILSYRYRNRRKRFGLRFNLIAGLYNYEGRNIHPFIR